MKYLIGIFSFIFFLFPFVGVFAWDLTVEIPNGDWFQDIIADDQFITWNNSEDSFTKFVQLINTYLRIVILVVVLLMLIYAWFTLITSRWNEEKFKTWNQILLHTAVWVWVALLAYVIVSIVVNFF